MLPLSLSEIKVPCKSLQVAWSGQRILTAWSQTKLKPSFSLKCREFTRLYATKTYRNCLGRGNNLCWFLKGVQYFGTILDFFLFLNSVKSYLQWICVAGISLSHCPVHQGITVVPLFYCSLFRPANHTTTKYLFFTRVINEWIW